MPAIDSTFLTFEWVMLGLRIAFIGLIYLFLYQIAQVSLRELVGIGRAVGTQESRRSSRPMQASIVVITPANASIDTDARIPISTYTTVGRSPDNALILDDNFTSSRHAEIVRDHNGWTVRDLASTNGTFVNDRPIHGPTRIESGDTIRFGNVIVEFDG